MYKDYPPPISEQGLEYLKRTVNNWTAEHGLLVVRRCVKERVVLFHQAPPTRPIDPRSLDTQLHALLSGRRSARSLAGRGRIRWAGSRIAVW